MEAWLGSLPGNPYANVRQPIVHTLNLAHMMPVSAVWAGPEMNRHLNAPPLMMTETRGSTPFRLDLHVGDVGHTLVVGPTGAGKSVLLSLLALQFRRFIGAQVILFDRGRSARAATLAMGGASIELGLEGTLSLQPLARIDEPGEIAFALQWVTALLTNEGVRVTPDVKDAVWTALQSLASAPRQERTLTGLAVLIQSNALMAALTPYTLEGAYGRLLDGASEELAKADVLHVEMEELMPHKALVPPVLTYLFHRLEARFDGRPTLLILDEAWTFLDDALFAARIREWLKTLRKKNVAVVFATQSLADIERSTIAPALIESCPTRIFLPNDRALEPQAKGVYERFGLNARQIEILEHGGAEARLLRPDRARQPPVRAGPRSRGARLVRCLDARRPQDHRPMPCGRRQGRLRGPVPGGQGPRLGRGADRAPAGAQGPSCSLRKSPPQSIRHRMRLRRPLLPGRQASCAEGSGADVRPHRRPAAAWSSRRTADGGTALAVPRRGRQVEEERPMTPCRHARIAVPVIAGVLAWCPAQPAAQLTVFDPANFQQNLLSAARALEQINNQVLTLQNQALMIARMDLNLKRLGPTLSPDLQRTLSALQAQLTAGEGIALRLSTTQSAYEQLFPKQASAALTSDDALRNAKARWDEAYAVFQRAALVQGQVADGIGTDTSLLAAALGRSRDAVGCARSRAGRQRADGAERQAGPRAAGLAGSAAPRGNDRQGTRPRGGGGRAPKVQDLPRQRQRVRSTPMSWSPTMPRRRRRR